MNDYVNSVLKLNEAKFRQAVGIPRPVFNRIVVILDEDYRHAHHRRGRHSKLLIEAKVLMPLEHLRVYPTYFDLSLHYDVSETTVRTITEHVEMVLHAHPDFRLPSHKEFLDERQGNECFTVDATDTPIERPKKAARIPLGQAKGPHPQVPTNCPQAGQENHVCRSRQGVPSRFCPLYGFGWGQDPLVAAVVFTDSYQGIKKYHPNSFIPIKKPRNGNLSKEDRRYNRAFSKARIMIEHINAKLKRFKIISSRCRSRHGFFRRFDLI